jgi:hypothetical protein
MTTSGAAGSMSKLAQVLSGRTSFTIETMLFAPANGSKKRAPEGMAASHEIKAG